MILMKFCQFGRIIVRGRLSVTQFTAAACKRSCAHLNLRHCMCEIPAQTSITLRCLCSDNGFQANKLLNEQENEITSTKKHDEREQIYLNLKAKWPKNDGNRPFPREDVLNSFVNILLSVSCEGERIQSFIIKHSAILQKSLHDLEGFISILHKLNFSSEQLIKLLAFFTNSELPKQNVISNNINTIRSFGVGEGKFQTIIEKHPEFFNTSPQALTKRFRNLQEIIPMSKLKQMIVDIPTLLIHPIENTLAKYEYIINEMGLTDEDISRSMVFKCSLDHIKARHQFLYRAGRYEKPQHDGKTKHIENARLRRIVDTSDLEFSRKEAGMEMVDYWCFRNLLSTEESDGPEISDSDEEKVHYYNTKLKRREILSDSYKPGK